MFPHQAGKLIVGFVIKHTMAKAGEIWVLYLVAELSAHTFVFFCAFQTAWAVTAGAFQPFFDRVYDFLVWIEYYLHKKKFPFINMFPYCNIAGKEFQ